jgi:uncharacterized protein
MPDGVVTGEAILRDYPRLGGDDTFRFTCGAHLDCFTTCCSDISIVLTPYDVLRLKKAVGLDSSEFLAKYTISPFTPEQKVPVVLLRMDPETKRCPFVTSEGCTVYNERPWACRMYPLGIAEPREITPTERPFHFLIREQTCHGHDNGTACSVRDWMTQQGIEQYEMMGASFKELMLHDFWDSDEALPPEKMEMYHTACYDLDRFRRFVFETRFLKLFDVDEGRVEAIRTDDVELLEFAIQWLRFSLFKEKTMKVMKPVLEAKSQALAAEAKLAASSANSGPSGKAEGRR